MGEVDWVFLIGGFVVYVCFVTLCVLSLQAWILWIIKMAKGEE